MSNYVKQNHQLPSEVVSMARTIANRELRDAYVKALRGLGWTYESIGNAFEITRERARQIAKSSVDTDKANEFPLPTPPIAPEVVKTPRVIILPSDETLSRLLELQPLAQQVRSHSKKYRKEAEEYSYLLNKAVELEGVSVYRLAKLLGITHGAIRFRLARYGYKTETTGKSLVYSAILDKNRVSIDPE